MNKRGLRRLFIVPLALLLLGAGYGEKAVQRQQPAQMRSQVNYDSNLSDPFYKSEEFTCRECPECTPKCPGGKPPSKHTAKCLTSYQDEHLMNFCYAKMLDDGTIKLCIDGHSEELRIVVQNGVFWSQYIYYYKQYTPEDEGLRWTTTKQQLTLDKKVYRKGDIIKGKILFECEEMINKSPPGNEFPRIIKVKGVFKTMLK